MFRHAVNKPSLNGPLRRPSAYGAIASASDRAASRAAESRSNVFGSFSSRDSSALRLLSRLSRKLILLQHNAVRRSRFSLTEPEYLSLRTNDQDGGAWFVGNSDIRLFPIMS